MKKRIYIAGPLTPRGLRWDAKNPAIEYLYNVRDMIAVSVKLMKKNWAVYCPALDYHFFLALEPGDEITEPMIKGISLDWLEVCEAVLFIGAWKESKGSLEEHRLAADLGLDIYYDEKAVPVVDRDLG